MAAERKRVSGGAGELSILFEISQILDSSLDLRTVVEPVLEAMTVSLGLKFATLTLLNRQTGDISIESAYGLSASQKQRGRYRLGEGVTGKVIQTGKPAIVPKISEEPHFLDKTRARKGLADGEFSFICVPIKLGREVVGALSADRPATAPEALQEDARILSVVASLIAQAVKLRQSAQEERERLVEENLRLQEELKDRFRPSNIIGNSKAMQEVYQLIAQVSASDASVLLRGESGTGKELVAHAIHYASRRAARSFIKVNCAALPESVIESELFGHEKGAFTGAVAARKGRFELAHGGTLFLDEIGDLSPGVQIKLLRVLQEREFERVGGMETIRSDVRIIAATNRNLEMLIEKELFRQDLYYRLNVFPIHIPPLRERRTDILLLADYFAERYSGASGKRVRRISTPAIDMLMAYHWPGNVRELENCIERAVLLSDDEVIHGHHLPPTLQTAEASGTTPRGTLRATLERVEKELLVEALKSSRGNMAAAAEALGLTERIMGLRVRTYRIAAKRFRASSAG
ncbi:MAG: sigma 54-interacting transcriptional regulator [Spirochaetes bacterium]|nr:sigma 54-interacting transcriptional regulator [Spirochaetota bacterium]